ncbi:MAG: bifunctional diaminohydroxyphosphoribosylaminopyrimidine deaminase/5-amino-6-(5-phosphoribosylamino)uracil reductase RibD [Phycisphaerales bacterium]|nr:MAG: bifunctional diaminohydroxyphosphoribosylaminopyrimidine deaminase/5-amino-6-(5-phosphoribosylamino)uracil reductase RibD [Phycisphaerales bacterium]
MRRALRLALRGEGRVEPNPMVGCVLTRRGRVIGEGYHHRFGGPHAEVEALKAAGGSCRGAAAYVTLEPCAHVGKTPPCCDALIAAGVARVVVGTADPNPHVPGGGIERLRRAGIRVDAGVCESEARRLIAPFTTRVTLGRPYVIAKWAQSLDGRLAAEGGDSKWISCEASRRLVHRWRGRVDAILIGAGTAVADDPVLTARGAGVRRVAARVVMDGRLRLPVDAQLAKTARDVPTLVLTLSESATSDRADALRRLGVEVVSCGRPSIGRLDPATALRLLARRGATNVLLEGGATLIRAFLAAGLIDEARVFVGPIWIGGGDAHAIAPAEPVRQIAAALKPHDVTWRRSGDDGLAIVRFRTQ